MAKKRTYFPPKTFDDDLAGLVDLFKEKKWTFSGVDGKAIEKDAVAQRDERGKHDAMESQYVKMHEEFGMAQDSRYQRFAAALNAARGAFRNDKAVVKELDRFKRSVRKAKKTAK